MFSFQLYKVDPCYPRQPKLARSTLKAGTCEDPPYEGSQLKTAAARQFGPVHRIPHGALVDGQTCSAVRCRTNTPYHYPLQANYRWAKAARNPTRLTRQATLAIIQLQELSRNKAGTNINGLLMYAGIPRFLSPGSSYSRDVAFHFSILGSVGGVSYSCNTTLPEISPFSSISYTCGSSENGRT